MYEFPSFESAGFPRPSGMPQKTEAPKPQTSVDGGDGFPTPSGMSAKLDSDSSVFGSSSSFPTPSGLPKQSAPEPSVIEKRKAAMKNPGALPEKTPDGKLSVAQVQQYMNNTPEYLDILNTIDTSTDFSEVSMRKTDIKRFENTLSKWEDTPPDSNGISQRTINGVQFTNIKKATLGDGTKVFNTDQGCFMLGADGFPGKQLSPEAIAKHGGGI